ncbi:MAG: nuclear transport factor 2 family protein [Thermoanaerobaculia bacterium]|nr:nuclear transport factor 2 family protein [Thermoanaerobaculia bacterium]
MKRGAALRRALSIALVALASLTSAAPAATPADEAELRHLKEVLWPRAYFEQDVALLDALLADEFQMVDAAGNWSTKRDQLERVRTSKPDYDSLRFEIKRLEVFADGTAIVAGEGTIRGVEQNRPYVATYQSTNVLVRRDGRWQAVASHVSGVKEAE